MTVTVTLEPVASPFVSPTLSPIEIKKKEPSKRNPPPLPSKLVPTISPTTEKPCHSLSAHTVAHFSCETGAPSIILYGFLAFLPLLLICCCYKYCCGGNQKGRDVKGEYRVVANTYGDASFDNAFSDNFSDDEDEDFGSKSNGNENNNGDVEESWGKSGGKRVLEMSKLAAKDDLSLEEMNG